jgi:hypothetical protein
MKKLTIITVLVALSVFAFQAALSQTSATQTVTLQVSSVQKLTVSGNPAPLAINVGVAGTEGLTSVTDATTTYSETHNSVAPLKITAGIDVALGAGYTLQIALASTKGTSAGTVDISNATTAVSVVTAIAKGSDNGKVITYTFSATATAGVLTSTTKTITLTITS